VLMRFPWQAREFERTCLDCGYSWQVPATVGRRRRGPISGYSAAPRGLRVPDDSVPELAATEAISEVAGAYRHCPRCSSERYSQRRVKG
jgi:hypothetical protein